MHVRCILCVLLQWEQVQDIGESILTCESARSSAVIIKSAVYICPCPIISCRAASMHDVCLIFLAAGLEGRK